MTRHTDKIAQLNPCGAGADYLDILLAEHPRADSAELWDLAGQPEFMLWLVQAVALPQADLIKCVLAIIDACVTYKSAPPSPDGMKMLARILDGQPNCHISGLYDRLHDQMTIREFGDVGRINELVGFASVLTRTDYRYPSEYHGMTVHQFVRYIQTECLMPAPAVCALIRQHFPASVVVAAFDNIVEA